MTNIIIINHNFNFKLKIIVINYIFNHLKRIKIIITNYNLCDLYPCESIYCAYYVTLKHVLVSIFLKTLFWEITKKHSHELICLPMCH